MLAEVGGLAGLGRIRYGDLSAFHGISEAKACQLLASVELGRRLVSLSPGDRPVIRSPQDVSNLLAAEIGFLDQVHLRALLLSTKNEVRGIHGV